MEEPQGLRRALVTVAELMENEAIVFGDGEGGSEAGEDGGEGPVIGG